MSRSPQRPEIIVNGVTYRPPVNRLRHRSLYPRVRTRRHRLTFAPIIAANRFGLGARPGELADIGGDPQGWLIKQVTGTRPASVEMNRLPSSTVAFQTFADALRQRFVPKDVSESDAGKRREEARKQIAGIYREQVAARYRLAARTEEPFRERLVHFWTNHFALSADTAK